MKMVLKFKNGEKVTINNLSELNSFIQQDVFKALSDLKQSDSPIVITGENGERYESSGKELLSLEIILE